MLMVTRAWQVDFRSTTKAYQNVALQTQNCRTVVHFAEGVA